MKNDGTPPRNSSPPDACPRCDKSLVLRRNRKTGEAFLGCPEFPACRHTVPLPALEAALRDEVYELRAALRTTHHRVRALVMELAQLRWNATSGLHVVSINMDHELRRLISVAHPDRWQDHPVATKLSQELIALRERVQRGVYS